MTKGLNYDVEMKDSEIKWASIVPLHGHYSKIKYEIMPMQCFIHSNDKMCEGIEAVVAQKRSNWN